jgi:hypothetical protein
VKEQPGHIDQRELVHILREQWGLAPGAADHYAELTGRRVSAAAMDLYRLRWSLDDIALFVADFRGPHEQDEDTELAWAGLTDGMGAI